MRSLTVTVSMFVALLANASAQQIWRVNCSGGPGIDFTDLPPAVAAAAPGDEIWVYLDAACPVGWQGYTAPVIDRGVRIVGFNVASSSGPPSIAEIFGLTVVTGIPHNQSVSISNIHIVNVLNGSSGIVLVDCEGDVLLEDVLYRGHTAPGSYLHIQRCANVVLRGCEFEQGGNPLTIIDSNVLLTTTSVWDVTPICGLSIPTSEGIRVVNSSVTAIGSLITGADFACWPNHGQQPGVVIESGVFRVGPGTLLRGGWLSWPQVPEVAYRLVTPQASIELDPRGAVARLPDPPLPQPVPIDLPATYHSWAVAGEPVGVSVVGPPSGFALLMVGDWAPGQPPGPFGTLAIAQATAVPVALAALDAAQGLHVWPFLQIPSTAPVAHPFAFQALTIAPDGTLGLSEPSPLTVGWPHGVIP